jgi:putative glycosyltransferase (TIGR04372 family)
VRQEIHDMKVFLGKVRRRLARHLIQQPLYFIGLPVFILCVLVARLLFSNLKIYSWRSWRVGHQAADMDLFLRRRELHGHQGPCLFLTERPANKALLSLFRRRLWIVRSSTLVEIHRSLKDRGFFSETLAILPAHRHPNIEFRQTLSRISLSSKDRRRGEDIHRDLGIGKNDEHICFHARDGQYLKRVDPKIDYSYHDYRDFSANDCLPALDRLANQGLWCLRLGAVTQEKIKGSHPRVIDYANLRRSDFGDVFLGATSKFYLGSTAGIFNIPILFNVPVACINIAPLGEAPPRQTDLFIVKKFWSKKEQRFLKFRELIKMGADRWGFKQNFDDAGIKVVNNTPQEIADLAEEMSGRLDGTYKYDGDAERLQKIYRDLWPTGHHVYGYPSRIGTQFLKDHVDLLD